MLYSLFDWTGNETSLRFVSLGSVLFGISPNGGCCPYISGCARVAAGTGLTAESSGVLAVWIPSRMLRSFLKYASSLSFSA